MARLAACHRHLDHLDRRGGRERHRQHRGERALARRLRWRRRRSRSAGDILILQGNLTETATLAALRTGRARRDRNPEHRADRVGSAPRPAEADIVVANAGEAEPHRLHQRGGSAEPVEAGAGAAIVTRGANDALLGRRTGLVHLPVETVAVVDTPGRATSRSARSAARWLWAGRCATRFRWRSPPPRAP